MFYGQGAGSLPTASAVVSDIMNVIFHMRNGMTGEMQYLWQAERQLYSQDEVSAPYYLRLMVDNSWGVLASISGVLGESHISIRSLIQKDETKEVAEVVLLIDSCKYGLMRKALKKIEDLPCVRNVAGVIRLVEV